MKDINDIDVFKELFLLFAENDKDSEEYSAISETLCENAPASLAVKVDPYCALSNAVVVEQKKAFRAGLKLGMQLGKL